MTPIFRLLNTTSVIRFRCGLAHGVLAGMYSLLGLSITLPDQGNAAAYVFTNIADNGSAFFDFPGVPSVNSSGTVAFYAQRVSDVGIFKGGIGMPLTTVVTNTTESGKFADFGVKPAINVNGVVAFEGELANSSTGIFTSSGGASTTIAVDVGPFRAFGQPTLNASAKVAVYTSFDDVGGQPGGEAISAFASGATTNVDKDSTSPRNTYGLAPTINGSGTVAFRANLDAGGSGLFAGNGVDPVATVAQTTPSGFSAFNDPAINDAGFVAFRAESSSTNARGIYKASAGAVNPVAVSGAGLFSNFADSVSINNTGSVAFVGQLFEGGRGIYVDTNGVRERVIGTGDGLFGSTIINSEFGVAFGNTALNDAGQVAFRYTLANGRTGIALASVPEAGTGVLLSVTVGLLLARRRRNQSGYPTRIRT